MKKVKWGIISTANIGVAKVIPAMQDSEYCEIIGIASRNENNAKEAAEKLNIPKYYGSYEALLNDEDIEAIYIPLPNHLHVEWTIKCLEAGKHVLCEKPISLNYEESEKLFIESKKYPNLKVMEAFMYRFHPQWAKVLELINNGEIGKVKHVQSYFSYYNVDVNNVRNMADIGGGGILDIGCYSVSLSRYILGKEPLKLCSLTEYDEKFKTDILSSAILDFGNGKSAGFTCGTQLNNSQNVIIFGTEGLIEMKTPFYPENDKGVSIFIKKEMDIEEIHFDHVDHYTLQGDMFSKAILNDSEVPTPLEDAVANMKVLDKLAESSKSGAWVSF